MHIDIDLKRNRRLPGRIALIGNDQRIIVSGICMGKADDAAAAKVGNVNRSPLLPCGDTPTGNYEGRLLGNVPKPERSFGTVEPIVMTPNGGECVAAHANGRRGLWIHSGDMTPGGFLRPTHGCVRITHATHAAVVTAMKRAGIQSLAVEVKEQ